MSDYTIMSQQRDSKNSEEFEKSYYYEESKNSAGNGIWILKPNGTNGIGITLEVTAGSGKVQATNSSIDKIIASQEVSYDWPDGTVTGTTVSEVTQVTAIRQVNYTGTTKLIVSAD